MRKINKEELRSIQINILDSFNTFCQENNIHYWLDYGTLLGAVRHKGFIPWDDDIDIAMLREDYQRVEALFNKQSGGRYSFKTPQNDSDYDYPFGKLIDNNTILYEYGENGLKTGVYIDVFVYDRTPLSDKDVRRQFKRRDFLGRIRRLKLPCRDQVTGIKKGVFIVGSYLLKSISLNKICKMLDKNARKYEKVLSEKVSPFVDPYDTTYFCMPRSLFTSLANIEFEGKKYPAPLDYDLWLKKLYGNYWQLPPVEERQSTHVIDAYIVNEEI